MTAEAPRRPLGTEHARLAAIAAWLEEEGAAEATMRGAAGGARARDERGAVEVGVGDDAAVVVAGGRGGRPGVDPVVVTVDAAVEGVHFRVDFASPRVIARRAVMAAASDVPAMGALPTAVVVAFGLPATLDDATLEALVRGTADAARELGCRVVGGNLTRASELSITTTVLGALLGPQAVTRAGAQAGDVLMVTGVLGAAALGLRALLAAAQAGAAAQCGAAVPGGAAAPFVEAWARPRARVDRAAAVAAHATACVDVSDGLLADLGHLARASGVGLRVDPRRLPLAPEASAVARALGVDATALALSGGEDYELALAAPPSAREALMALGDFTEVGAVDPRVPAGRVWLGDGEHDPAPADDQGSGFDHFARRGSPDDEGDGDDR